jgi:multiple sugar transport system permease protein
MARVAVRHRATIVPYALATNIVKSVNGWMFLLPAMFFFITWQAYPILRVLWLSFTDFYYLRVDQPIHFVGLDNYVEALHDPLVRAGLFRAALFTIMFLPGMIAIPLFTAILLDRLSYRHPELTNFYRLVFLLPAMIPGPLIFVLWKWLYSYTIGPINYFLVDILHLFTIYNAPQWLGDSRLILPAVTIMEWWWGLGYHTIFFLAGLAAIPRDLYDAARVDGAGEWALFWHITLPRLQPVLLILTVLRFGTAMALIDEYLIFGGTNRALPTYTWTVYMWDLAFQIGDWRQSYAAAIGWVGALLMLLVMVGFFWLFRPRD